MDKESLKKVGVKRVISFFWKMTMTNKWPFFVACVGMVICSLASLILPIFYTRIVDVVQVSNVARISLVPVLIGILISMAIVEFFSVAGWRMVGFSTASFEPRVMRRIFEYSFAYLNKHSFRFFSNNFSGALVKKVNKLTYSYEIVSDIFIFNLIRIIIYLPFIVIVVGKKSPIIGLIFLAFILIFSLFQYFFFKWNMPYEIRANQQDSKVTGELSDTITNHFNVLTFASLTREVKRFGDTVKYREYLIRKKRMRAEWMFFVSTLLIFVFEISSIYFAIQARGKGLISAGMIILIQVYIFKLFEQLFNIRNILKQLNRAIGESAEMLEILDKPHEIADKSDKNLVVNSGKIELRDLKFTYNNAVPIFDGLNLDIKPGEKIAIVGHSGSGKTTLAKLLLRFFDIQGGEILIDGQNIANVTQESLRKNISIVPQDPILFHRSLRENIVYGRPDVSNQEMVNAAKMARCHKFIIGFKDGYETLVGERGIKLSGGERQRVAIARAILENKRIFILDEATSSLDSESEKLIQEAINEVIRNKTVIVIAHRLSTIMKMDKIIVMDNGKIIEKGSHRELLAKNNGIYKNLRDIQSGGFIE